MDAWRAACRHPLCGQIHATGRKPAEDACGGDPWIALTRSWRMAETGGAILLGEMHDDPEHHKFRATLIEELSARDDGQRPGLVFEQIRADQQAGLDAFADSNDKAARLGTVGDLKRFLDWDKSGWSKDGYDPLLEAALEAKLPIYPGDVTRDAIKKVAKEGAAALPAGERARLKLDIPLGAKLDDASLSEIEASHCGLMPKSAFGGMAFAQRYRDASLADALLKAADKHGSAILIAGNGHVRTDRGAPWYIRQRAPDKHVVSVMLIEVEDGAYDPEVYVPRDPDGKPAADYIVFTPRAERADPCEGMRDKMGK